MDKAKAGHTVQFQGLKGAAHLNGTTGTLVKYLKEEGRWSVRTRGELVNAKPINLERIIIDQRNKTEKTQEELFTQLEGRKVNAPAKEMAIHKSTGIDGYVSPHGHNHEYDDPLPDNMNELGQGLGSLPDPHYTLPGCDQVHYTILDAYHKRKMEGVVISGGDVYMIAIKFSGVFQFDGVQGTMVFIDKWDKKGKAMIKERNVTYGRELGRLFLYNLRTQYILCNNERSFVKLVDNYTRTSKKARHGLIDKKSGLRVYDIRLTR